MNHPACPHCQQNQTVIKSGYNRVATQRYHCQTCREYFTPEPKSHAYEPAVRQLALQLYLEGTSFRGIARLLVAERYQLGQRRSSLLTGAPQRGDCH